ncbi:MAG: FkbM family methyltransferase [Aquificae bacterium]|nr:FkbM family methyltransferase [Aquificota bacterium]
MLIDTRDSYGIDVLLRGKIETPEDEFIKKILKPENVVLDIGAHWGGFSLLFAHIVGEKGKVYSFEPDPSNYQILLKNIKLNGFQSIVKPQNVAVGDKDSYVELGIANTSSGHNSLLRKDIPIKKKIKVRQIKLDKHLPNTKVDFIKIDVEGYEYFVLKGLETTIQKNNLWLFIEFSPKFMGKELTERMVKFLKKYFQEIYIAHKRKVFKTNWEQVLQITYDYGQRNLFLRKVI